MTWFKFHLFVLLAMYSLAGKSQAVPLRMPAEWEKQKAILVNYSGNPEDTIISGKVQSVCRDIIRALSAETTVYVLINELYNKDSLQQLFAAGGINTANVILLPVYGLFTMGVPRDYGPIIVQNQAGKNNIIRFHWDYVGADFVNPDTAWARRRELIRDRYFAQMGKILQMEIKSFPLTIEGG